MIHVEPLPSSQLERLFPGDSEMAARMRTLDWSATDFGPPANWPENLRVAVSICLPCRFPIVIWWGKRFCLLYNDAHLPWLTAEKHPRVLGRPGIVQAIANPKFCQQNFWAIGVELDFLPELAHEDSEVLGAVYV